MLDQNINFETLILRVIFTLALAVFVLMLVTAFALFRSDGKTRAQRISGVTLRGTLRSMIGILETNPKDIQTLNWVACLVIAAFVAWLNYSGELHILNRTSLYPYLIALAILSPTCLAVAWLRLTGMKWRSALSLFVWVPVAFGGSLLIRQLIAVLLYYLGFGS